MRLATSSCNPSCQECRSITHALLRTAVPMRLLASRSVTANRPTFAQRQQCELFKAMLHPQFFAIFVWNQSLAIVWCAVCRPHLPKVFWTPQFFCSLEVQSRALAAVRNTCSRQLSKIEARNRGETETILWPPQEPHYPKKHKVSRAKLLSPVNSHVPKLLLSSTASTRALLLLTILTWWWHDMKTATGHSPTARKFSN